MKHLLDFFDRYVHGRGVALLHDDGTSPSQQRVNQRLVGRLLS
jgi:hypothetical protein